MQRPLRKGRIIMGPKATINPLTWIILLLCCLSSAQSTSENATGKRVLKATSIQIPPFLMVSDEGNGEVMEGIVVDILREMEKIMNATIEIVLVKDGSFGKQNEEGNWTGMIGEVKSGLADIAAAPLTLTSGRVVHVDMSQPFLTFGLQIVIKRPPGPTNDWNSIFLVLQPFTPLAWILILLACGVTGATLSVIGYFSPFEWTNTSVVQVSREKRESFNWKNSFWYIITTFMWQGYRYFPRSYSGRVLSIFWWIFALFMLTLYIGCIAAHLRSSPVPLTGLPFMTFDEMAHQREVAYGTLQKSSTLNYFKNSPRPIDRQIYQNMLRSEDNMVSSISEGFEKVRSSDGRYAFILEGILAEYTVGQHPCDLMMVGESIHPRSYSFITDQGSPLSWEVNHAILKLSEMNVIQMIHKKWRTGECFGQISHETFVGGRSYYDKMEVPSNSVSFGVLGAYFIAGPLIVLLIGIIVSGIVLGAEVFFAKQEMKRVSSSSDDGHQLRDSFEE